MSVEITDTAAAVARVRSWESQLPEEQRLFEDPYAHLFAGGEAADEAVQRFLSAPIFREHIRLRTRFIDDAVRAALAAGIAQVVNLGVGFDCRTLRLTEIAEHDAQVFEVDLGGAARAQARASSPRPALPCRRSRISSPRISRPTSRRRSRPISSPPASTSTTPGRDRVGRRAQLPRQRRVRSDAPLDHQHQPPRAHGSSSTTRCRASIPTTSCRASAAPASSGSTTRRSATSTAVILPGDPPAGSDLYRFAVAWR